MRFLNEVQGNALLSEFGISMVPTFVCQSQEDVSEHFQNIGGTAVMKILSKDILHKSDIGGVKLNIETVEQAETAYEEILANAKKHHPDAEIEGVLIQRMLKSDFELIFGVNKDAQFGHVLVFGFGGVFVELFKDVSLRILPITREDAEDMISETKISQIFEGFRGGKYNEEEVIDTLLKLNDLIKEHPEIEEIDINPYILYKNGDQGYGVDALIRLES